MADFVDYTNATELEKFTFKLGQIMKKESIGSDSLIFRGVEFQLSRVISEEDQVLRGIPHFRYENCLSKYFDLEEFWLLECVEKGRVVSEATGRLLLGALIQNVEIGDLAVFVRIGEVHVSEKYLGFRRCDKSEYFETFLSAEKNGKDDLNEIVGAQVILEWFPSNLRVGYPGFSGYFDSWHPIEKISVRSVWPQIPRDGIKFVREDLQTAPILVAEYEEAEEKVALRNTTLRSIQAGHLREILFTPMGEMSLISFTVISGDLRREIVSIGALYEKMAAVYRAETEKLESDFTFKYNFIPKRVLEVMRWDRLNETFSLLWRRFVKGVEVKWNELKMMDIEGCCGDSEIEKSLKLVNWCIERELEWQGALNDHVLLKQLYKIPRRHLYTTTIDDKIEKLAEKMEKDLQGIGELLEDPEEFSDCIDDVDDATEERTVLEHGYNLNGHVVYEPVVLNCEPPPTKLLTKSLLKNPLAGDVIALNQLREDMRVFKAWNEELSGVACVLNDEGLLEFEGDGLPVDLGFIGFLLWHSPNDIEPVDGKALRVSQRMRDPEGQWLQMWRQATVNGAVGLSLSSQVSFNHRAMLGQVMSDLTLKIDLNQLLESATPFLTRKAAELMGEEAVEILERLEGESEDGKYPLDRINEKLDEYEQKNTKKLVLQALCSNIFKDPEVSRVLVAGDEDRQFLLNRQHEFKFAKKEIVARDGGFRELCSGFEGIVVKLSY